MGKLQVLPMLKFYATIPRDLTARLTFGSHVSRVQSFAAIKKLIKKKTKHRDKTQVFNLNVESII